MEKSFPKKQNFQNDKQNQPISFQCLLTPYSLLLTLPKGAARQSIREFINFLYVSLGSVSELDTQLELSKRFGYISASDWSSLNQKLQEADRVIIGLIKAQKAKLPK